MCTQTNAQSELASCINRIPLICPITTYVYKAHGVVVYLCTAVYLSFSSPRNRSRKRKSRSTLHRWNISSPFHSRSFFLPVCLSVCCSISTLLYSTTRRLVAVKIWWRSLLFSLLGTVCVVMHTKPQQQQQEIPPTQMTTTIRRTATFRHF